MRRRLAQASALLAVAAAQATAAVEARGSPSTGLSDQGMAFFDAPAYRALSIAKVRLIVPWDAGLRAGRWDAWIDRALRDGADVLVALEHDDASRCPDDPCSLPGAAAYGDALVALLAKHPAIRAVTPWNEPNHSSQPTFRDPAAAARYYDIARARCPRCIVVAGDFLDDPGLPGYLSSYKASLSSSPAVWGLHDYFDSTYFSSRGVDTMLEQTGGSLWLTETGGIVSFRDPGGGIPYDEQRAADSVAWIYDLADRRPDIDRIYLYQWQGTPDNAFDSGLVGYDGAPRPAYRVVSDRGASRPATPASGAKATLRAGRRLRLLPGGRLELRARCVARSKAAARCRGRLVARVAGVVVARISVDIAARRVIARVVRLARWANRHLLRARRPRVALQTCAPRGGRCTGRAYVRVSRAQGSSRRAAPRAARAPD